MFDSTPSCASGTLVAPENRCASFSKTRVKLSAVGAANCPTVGTSPSSSLVMARNDPTYALNLAMGDGGATAPPSSPSSSSPSPPSPSFTEKRLSLAPRMYRWGNVKNSAPTSMRSTSRMALSTMPRISGVSMEWPSGRSGSGS